MAQMWGGRFADCVTNSNLMDLNCSLPVDRRLFADDIDGSKAYAEGLERAGLLTREECDTIRKGLELVRYDWIERLIKFIDTDEDVHTVNERRLIELIGEVGQKLHTGRSRNDQVITDMKLWLRKGIRETVASVRKVIEAAMQLAETHSEVIMPGYTHLQRAQPVRFAQWILSHAFALQEDCLRLIEVRKRSNFLPLGSGAIAGNPLGIDRTFLANKLGFSGVTQNSMHAVGDRDFVVDFIYCASMTSLHLSRLAEDLIIFATKEFNFVKISNSFSTGSSLMPQKRNPDSLELVRGISGSIFACLSGAMMTIKGTPSTYNKDLQFDKRYCFDAFDQLQKALLVTEGVLSTLEINGPQMESSLSADMLATDWAYYLVRKGVPFRQAHDYVGKVVALAEEMNVDITGIPLERLQKISTQFEEDIAGVSDYRANVEQYDVIGGTSSKSICQQLKSLGEFVESIRKFD